MLVARLDFLVGLLLFTKKHVYIAKVLPKHRILTLPIMDASMKKMLLQAALTVAAFAVYDKFIEPRISGFQADTDNF